jgi:O-antigen/teichoic acid export membrane protein
MSINSGTIQSKNTPTDSALRASPTTIAETEPIPPLVGFLSLKLHTKRNLGILGLRYGLGLVINVAGAIALSRILGPGLWGVFAIALTIYAGSQEVLGRGIATYLIKMSGEPAPSDIRTAFALQHALGLCFLTGILALAHPAAHWYQHAELVPLFIACAVAAYGHAWRSIPIALLERNFEYGKVAVIEILEALVFVAVAIPMVWLGHTITGLGTAIALRGWLPTGLAYALKPAPPALFFPWRDALPAADFGLSISGGSVVNLAMLSVPVLIVGKLAGMAALGVAQMALSLYGSLLFATAAILRLAFSTYSRLAAHPVELRENVNRHLQILAATLLPVITLFAGCSPAWVPWIFGARWNLLPAVLLVLAPGYFFVSVFWGILNPALLVSGKHRQILLWLFGMTALYASLSLALTPRWGAVGLAVAFSAAEISFHPLLFRLFRRTIGKFDYRKILAEVVLGTAFLITIWDLAARRSMITLPAAGLYLGLWYWRNVEIVEKIRKLACP